VTLALVLAAVVVERGEAGEGGGLLAADAAELGHADEEGEGGALADAGHAEDELAAAGQIGMGRDRRCEAAHLGGAAGLEADDVGLHHAALARLVHVLQAGLEAGGVFLGLLQESEAAGELLQAGVRGDGRRLAGRRAGGDQKRVEAVVLGPAATQPGEGAHLQRLQDHDREPAARRASTTPRS